MSTTTNDVKEVLNMVNNKYNFNISFEEDWDKFEFSLKSKNNRFLCISNCEGCYQYLQGLLDFNDINK